MLGVWHSSACCWGQDNTLSQLTCPLPDLAALAVLVGPASPQRERPLAADDLRTVQTCLLGLVREFLFRNFPVDDMHVVLNFLAATSDEGQVGWRLEGRGLGERRVG